MKSVLISILLSALACHSAPALQDSAHSSTSSSAVSSSQSDNGNGYTQLNVSDKAGSLSLTLSKDGSVSATHDGMVVPQERLQRDGDHLRVLDEGGKTLYDLRLFPGGGISYPYENSGVQGLYWGGSGGWNAAGDLGRAFTVSSGAPRKIIGVVTTPVDEALAAQLGLKPESAVVINEVTPGMPAEKAGLQAFDVIVKIDGGEPVTRERLREVINSKEVGKTLQVSLIRKGQPLEVAVEVTETKDDAMGFAGFGVGGKDGPGASVWSDSTLTLPVRQRMDKARAELDAARVTLQTRIEALRKESEGSSGAAKEAREKAIAELEAALTSMNEATDHMRDGADGDSPEIRFFKVDNQGEPGLLLRRSQALSRGEGGGSSGGPEAEERLKRMEERLEQLDARLADMLKKLDSMGTKP